MSGENETTDHNTNTEAAASDAPATENTEPATSEAPAATENAETEAPASEPANDIPESSLTSAVTSDLPAGDGGPTEPSGEVDPAVEHAIGLVKVDGSDYRYIGQAPARDKDARTPGGLKITPENSTFTPLANVEFNPSIRCKDAETGEFYYPQDGVASWDQVELNGNKLIPKATA